MTDGHRPIGPVAVAVAIAAALALAGCIRAPAPAPPAPAPAFDPLRFFAGDSRGQAVLRRLFAAPEPIVVRSHGRIEGDSLVLDQTIAEPGKPPRARRWRIHAVAPGHYAGTLSDAAGPVAGDVVGNRLHLAFPLKGGFPADQYLTLAADGRSAHNIMIVRKFGLTIAVLDETIRRRD